MTTKRYKPNLNDSRVRTKLKNAIGWAQANLGDKPRPLEETFNNPKKTRSVNSDNSISKALGQCQNDLARWLRGTLLTVADGHYKFGNGGQCKTYTLNRAGLDKIIELLDEPTKKFVERIDVNAQVIQWATDRFGDELNSLDFQYDQKASARLWHPLQNMQADVANVVWNHVGLSHDYDVKACAPTLIKQHAVECGMSIDTSSLDAYLIDSRGFRDYLSLIAGITYKDAKTIINALFCGASLLANPQKSIFKLLDFDKAKLKKVRDSDIVQQLVRDINHCWLYIKPTGATSKQKWQIYFTLERKVLDAVRDYLGQEKNKHFCIHDGFRTSVSVDVCALSAHVKSLTGYLVEFSSSGTVQSLSSGTVPSGLLEPIITNLHGSSGTISSSYSCPLSRSPNTIEVEVDETVPDDCDPEPEYDLDETEY